MSRGIIINNPGYIETVINITAVNALDGDSIYAGSVYLSNISSDEISAVKTAIESYSPGGGGDDRYDEGYAAGTNDTKHAIAVDHQPIAEEYQTLLPGVADIQSQDAGDLIGQRNIFSLAADYLSEEKPGPTPPTPGPEIEPYYVPGWFDHQDGNWVLVKAGQTWEIAYGDTPGNVMTASYTAGDVDTWFNMDNEPFRQAVYVTRKNSSASGNNKILAMNLDMPNWIDTNSMQSSSTHPAPFNDPSLINVKIKINYLKDSGYYLFDKNTQMTTCVIDMYRPELTHGSVSYMFQDCRSLQSLDLSGWDVSNVTDLQNIFKDCHSLQSLDLSGWDVSNVTSMSSTFYNCHSLQSLDLSGWDVSNVTSMSSTFAGCHSLQSLDLSGWDVSNVTSMSSTFAGCYSLQSLDLSGWDVSNVTSMSSTFNNNNVVKVLKIQSKPKAVTLPTYQNAHCITNESLQWMADNFPDISGDDTYTNTTIGPFSSIVKARYMWDYFYNTMTAKGYTIS